MRVCLLSNEEGLRNFLSELANSELSFVGGEAIAEADFYIFDFEPASEFPDLAQLGTGNHLFLVDPKDLSSFTGRIADKPVSMLLKPVSRDSVRNFLDAYREKWSALFDNQDISGYKSDRDELLQHLLLANLRLQEYDQERTNFLARALHDLRTPLTSVQGICGLLLEGNIGPLTLQQKELLQRVAHSSERLARLTSGMFELSVQGRVHRALQLEQGSIENCLKNALEEVSSVIEEKQLRVASQMAPPRKAMWMESQQIERLLINLLENACRFTPRFGRIDIEGGTVVWDFDRSCAANPGALPNAYRIDIRDSGPGIQPSMLDAIFEQYTSIAGAEDRSGGGLGLAICKLAASAHGGRIWATSSKDGAVFSVVLPLDARQAMGRHRHTGEEGRARLAEAV